MVPIISCTYPDLSAVIRHAMLAVGYNDDQQVFVVRNSWGTDWVRT